MARDVKVFSGKYDPKGGDFPEKPEGLDLDRPAAGRMRAPPYIRVSFLFFVLSSAFLFRDEMLGFKECSFPGW